MVFEKKVIIGSIMSFIATTVGIIAVFFPDLLNLQKEKIASFTTSVTNKQEAQKFVGFLDDMVKEKRIFKLDIMICFPNSKGSYSVIDNFLMYEESAMIDMNKNDRVSNFVLKAITPFDSITPDELKEIYSSIPTEGYSGYILGSKNYYFDNVNDADVEWVSHWRRSEVLGKNIDCDFNKDEGLYISGYFLLTRSGNFKAATENRFESISAQQLKLKDY